MALKDLTGQRFGMLTALEPLEERHQGCVIWRCRCDCENIVLRTGAQLRKGVKTNCGCKPVQVLRLDLTGQRYGKLTVIRPTDRREHKHIVWECRCDCGNIAYVESQYLRDGTTQSCKACEKENLYLLSVWVFRMQDYRIRVSRTRWTVTRQ